MKGWVRTFSRLFKILQIVVKYGFRHARDSYFPGRRERVPAPVKLRQAFEELGPTFIKLGQFLSTRADFVPEYCFELSKLLDRVPPFPDREAREIIRSELGADPEKIFSSFPDRPVASASLAQVYAAALPGGERVAVKVQRPGIRRVVEDDLHIFLLLVKTLDWLRITHPIKAAPYVKEFADTVRDELNFELEAFNAQKLREKAVDNPAEKIPKVYPAYSTAKVLTTEYLQGVWLNEMLQTRSSGDEKGNRALEERGIDRLAVAGNIYRNSLIQLFERGVFHVDLHPANIVVMRNDLIGYVDFGVVGFADEAFRMQMLRYIECAATGDYEAALNVFLNLATTQKGPDMGAFVRDYRADLIRYHNAMRSPNSPLKAKSMGTYLARHMSSARRYGIAFPARTLAFSRALITLDIIVLQLAPEIDLLKQFAQFIEEARTRAALKGLFSLFDGARFTNFLLGLLGRLSDSPLSGAGGFYPGSATSSESGAEANRESRDGGNRRVSLVLMIGLMTLCWTILLSTFDGGALLRTSRFREIILLGFAAVTVWVLISARKLR